MSRIEMSPNRRIFLNVVATYGRSIYSIILGLFTCRWLLSALGHIDYGLLGVVGSLMGIVVFLNNVFASTISRFYSFEIGRANVNADDFGFDAIVGCRKLFTLALIIHLVLPSLLVLIGYPIGAWAIRNWLTIPINKVEVCIWVWRFTCVSGFVGMVSVPFRAMYVAKQEIAELTVYSVVQTTCNAIFIYMMTIVKHEWLFAYSCWTCILVSTPLIIISMRSIVKYRECRICIQAIYDTAKLKELISYAGVISITALSQMLSSNGIAVLVNKLLGPVRNAAMTIGSNLSSKSLLLTGAIQGAVSPAITNAAGANDYRRVLLLARHTNVFTTLAVAFFAVPLILEVDEVMILWLRNPPEMAGNLCRLLLIAALINQLTSGHVIAIFAKGRIFWFQLFESIIWLLVIFISWIAIMSGMDILGVGIGWIIMYTFDNILKIYCGYHEVGLSCRLWVTGVVAPVTFLLGMVLAFASLPVCFMKQSFVRLCVTTMCSEFAFIIILWFKILGKTEKDRIIAFARKRLSYVGQKSNVSE